MKRLMSVFGVASMVMAGIFPSPAFAGDEKFTINGNPVPEVVATVNGTPLSADLLKREIISYQLNESHTRKDVPPEEQGKIARQVLDDAIDREVLFQKTREMNIVIPPEQVEREITQIKSQFPGDELFMKALKFQHLDLDTLKERVERQMAWEEYVRKEVAPHVKVSDAQVEQFYRDNPDMFQQPERYSVRHIFLSATDEAHRELPEDAADRAKAERLIERLNANAKKTIDEIHSKLKSGGDFAALAKEYSEDVNSAGKGGSLGPLTWDHLPEEFQRSIKDMHAGDFSPPIQSSLGYHILQLDEKTPSHVIPLDEVKTEILNHQLRIETRKAMKEHVARLRKKADIRIFI